MSENSDEPEITEGDAERMVQMRRAGLTFDEIARVYRITPGEVFATLQTRIPPEELGAVPVPEPARDLPPVLPEPGVATQADPGHQPAPPPRRKRHVYRNIIVGTAAVVALVVVIAVVVSGGKGKTPAASASAPVAAPANNVTDPAGGVCPASEEQNGYCPGDSPSPTSTEASLTVGQTADITQTSDTGGNSGTATVTVTSAYNTTESADGFEAPQFGYYVVFNVSITSAMNGFNIDSSDFYVTINGQEYQEGNGTSYDAVENDNDLFGTVNAGNSMTGQLYFDLPSIHGELVYAPNYDGAPIAQWSF